jgi:hypothetical protein
MFTSPPQPMGGCTMVLDDVALSAPSATETATTLESSSNPAVAGEPVTFAATVVSGDVHTVPAGAVQFGVDGAPLGGPVTLDSDGRAELRSGTLSPGTHVVTATYRPAAGASFDPSEAVAVEQTVTMADTTTTQLIDPDPSVAGQPVVFTATVAPKLPSLATPTGTVQFSYDNGTPIGGPQPLDVAGKASVAIAAGAGTHPIVADYSGDANFNRSFELAKQTVNKADTTTRISGSANPVAPGGEVDFTVDIGVLPPGAVAPFGTLAFTVDGDTVFGPVPVFGANRVVLRATTGRPSTDTIGAVYSGDAGTNPSADSLTQVVASPSQPASPIAGAAPSSGAATTTASGSPPAGAPATATTANVLARMVDVLSAALRSRGLSALGRTKETITVDAFGTLNQTVYSPRAPNSAVATRKTSKNVVIASGQHRFDVPGAPRCSCGSPLPAGAPSAGRGR